MIVPSLTTLLADAPWKILGDLRPVSSTQLLDSKCKSFILLLGPVAKSEMAAVNELEPACVTFDLRFSWEKLAYPIPRVLTVVTHIIQKLQFLVKKDDQELVND